MLHRNVEKSGKYKKKNGKCGQKRLRVRIVRVKQILWQAASLNFPLVESFYGYLFSFSGPITWFPCIFDSLVSIWSLFLFFIDFSLIYKCVSGNYCPLIVSLPTNKWMGIMRWLAKRCFGKEENHTQIQLLFGTQTQFDSFSIWRTSVK